MSAPKIFTQKSLKQIIRDIFNLKSGDYPTPAMGKTVVPTYETAPIVDKHAELLLTGTTTGVGYDDVATLDVKIRVLNFKLKTTGGSGITYDRIGYKLPGSSLEFWLCTETAGATLNGMPWDSVLGTNIGQGMIFPKGTVFWVSVSAESSSGTIELWLHVEYLDEHRSVYEQ